MASAVWIVWSVLMLSLALMFYLRNEVGVAKGFLVLAFGPFMLLVFLASFMLGAMVNFFPFGEDTDIHGRIEK